jgi:uncharacterized protein
VEFFVLGRDRAGFDDDAPELDEAHWTYLDGYADRLTARGPTLSASGEHTGSVHIVRLDDRDAAVTFAEREPYRLAGLYEHLEIVEIRNLLGVTMWQRERLAGVDRSWLALFRWRPARELPARDLDAFAAKLRADRSVVFCGLLLDASGAGWTGLVAGFDAPSPTPPEVATSLAERIAGAQCESTVERWQRGGRDQ